MPRLSSFVEWAYGSQPLLFFEDEILFRQTGLQQGDPLRPLLFAVGLLSLLLKLHQEVPILLLHAWYLDDGVFVGRLEDLLCILDLLKEASRDFELDLNLVKTTLWLHPSCRERADDQFDVDLGITESLDDGFELLGAPVGLPFFCRKLVSKQVNKVLAFVSDLDNLEDP
jgi:hypothetical protein